ncbi:MAG: M15 family metallopeptidase [Spirochaetales bacterium]|nr:M15 family metallopeptidase [Spirochaetales bacterium]
MRIFPRGIVLVFLGTLTAIWTLATWQCTTDPVKDAAPKVDPPAEAAPARSESAALSGREVLEAFLAAYPGRFRSVELVDGDWSIAGDGVRFFWAGGRLLPQTALAHRDKYTPHPFYRSPAEQPPVPEYSDGEKIEIRARIDHREKSPPARHPGFYNYVWQARDHKSAERRTQGLMFLGKPVRVSVALVPVLRAINAEIVERSRTDGELKRFVASIRELSGFYWRNIANTGSLSYHSYGAAVDVISRNPKRKETYWLWAKRRDPDWFTRPLSTRLQPPVSFVAVFEKYGFVWGGKWFYFDTVHFEYRPEILILSGRSVARPPAR